MIISELVKPSPEIIREIKQSYNRILKRSQEAIKFLDDEHIPQTEKDKRVLTFKVEIVDCLETYLKVLQDWGVNVDDSEILGGMIIE